MIELQMSSLTKISTLVVATCCFFVFLSSAWGIEPHPSQPLGLTASGLHGIHRLGVPYAPIRHLTLGGNAGYGFIEPVGGATGAHHRMMGRFAVGAAPIQWLGFRLILDGYYDWHPDDDLGSDTTGMGNPTVAIRGGYPIGKLVQLGAEFELWIPGASAPSMEWSATTLDSKLLLALSPQEGIWTVASTVGFRLDNSENAAPEPETLRLGDRISLGISDFNAVLVGLGSSLRFSSFELLAELTFSILVGDGAPTSRSPMRFSLGGRYRVLESLRIELMTETLLTKHPEMGVDAPFAPIEPRFSVLLGLAYSFYLGKKKLSEPAPTEPAPTLPPKTTRPAVPPPTESAPPPTTTLKGQVVDVEGNPLGGASLHLSIEDQELDAQSGSSGEYEFPNVPIGQGTLTVSADGFEPVESVVEVTKEMSAVGRLTLSEAVRSQGSQLRGQILSFKGKPIKARITITPGNTDLETDESGNFTVDLPAGKYTVLIRATGYHRQTRKVEIEENSVTILNADLRLRNK